MERGNTTHSSRVDDELAHETDSLTHGAPVESHAEEWKLQEPAGEDQPDVSPFADGGRRVEGDAPLALTPDQVEARSEIARALPRSAFPGEGAQLVEVARRSGARDAVVDRLRTLPSGRIYEEVGEVWHDLGGPDETDLTRG